MNPNALFRGVGMVLLNLAWFSAFAATGTDLETLGTNQQVADRVAKLESRSRIGVVQNRLVPRNWRLELGGNYGPVASGDAYLNSQYLSGELGLHINSTFSLGVRYSTVFNSLTTEGKQRYERARGVIANQPGAEATIPAIDYPESMILGIVNWYMTHGKINLFDLQVVQLDLYSLAGYGQATLYSGPASVWTAGGGLVFWLNRHLSSRFELRYENYADQPIRGTTRNLNLIVGTFGMGVLF